MTASTAGDGGRAPRARQGRLVDGRRPSRRTRSPATWLTTETTPTAPLVRWARLQASSPLDQSRSVCRTTSRPPNRSPFASLTAASGWSASRRQVLGVDRCPGAAGDVVELNRQAAARRRRLDVRERARPARFVVVGVTTSRLRAGPRPPCGRGVGGVVSAGPAMMAAPVTDGLEAAGAARPSPHRWSWATPGRAADDESVVAVVDEVGSDPLGGTRSTDPSDASG